MNDEALLLQAICDDPADDTARLVFADYLQELGGNVNGAWALFIRGQIELARLGESADRTAAARVRLLDVPFWRGQWFARLGYGFAHGHLTCGEWARGFPRSITGAAGELRAAWPRLVARVPFENLKVTSATDDDTEDLVTRPGLGRVRELGLETDFFHPHPLGDRTFRARAGCAALRTLRGLSVSYVTVSDAAAEALLGSPHLANLGSFSARLVSRHRRRVELSAEVLERFNTRFGPHTIF